MLAAKRLLCVFSLAVCCASGAALAQSAGAPPVPATSVPPMAPLPNTVTPSATPTTSSGEPLRDRQGGEQSPLLNPETPWVPKTPLLPNASPDEPPLRAPLLPLDQ